MKSVPFKKRDQELITIPKEYLPIPFGRFWNFFANCLIGIQVSTMLFGVRVLLSPILPFDNELPFSSYYFLGVFITPMIYLTIYCYYKSQKKEVPTLWPFSFFPHYKERNKRGIELVIWLQEDAVQHLFEPAFSIADMQNRLTKTKGITPVIVVNLSTKKTTLYLFEKSGGFPGYVSFKKIEDELVTITACITPINEVMKLQLFNVFNSSISLDGQYLMLKETYHITIYQLLMLLYDANPTTISRSQSKHYDATFFNRSSHIKLMFSTLSPCLLLDEIEKGTHEALQADRFEEISTSCINTLVETIVLLNNPKKFGRSKGGKALKLDLWEAHRHILIDDVRLAKDFCDKLDQELNDCPKRQQAKRDETNRTIEMWRSVDTGFKDRINKTSKVTA